MQKNAGRKEFLGEVMDKKKISYDLFWFENELLKQCNISKNRFHKVRGAQ